MSKITHRRLFALFSWFRRGVLGLSIDNFSFEKESDKRNNYNQQVFVNDGIVNF